jgi:hypothetical protein
MSRPYSSSQKRKASRQKGKPRLPRYANLTARQKATYERALALLSELRRGVGSYNELLRKHHLNGRTARKYLGRDLIGGSRGKRVRASKSDRRVREVLFPTSVGDVLIRTRNSQDATKLSECFHDRDMLLRGKLRPYDFEAKWRDVHIAGREVFADTNGIFQMADADVLKVEHLYASASGER